MLVKWIRADVADRGTFDRGQRRWSVLAGTPGLLGQCGGWSLREPTTARIAAGWRDADAHDRFLADVHDDIAAAQRGTYTDLDVTLADVVQTVGEPLPAAGVLRSAWCRLRDGRADHALEVQERVWLPAMRAAGMISGLTALASTSMLVLSWWPDVATHHAYQQDRVPDLRASAATADDVDSVQGDVVALEPAWTVGATDPRGRTAPGG